MGAQLVGDKSLDLGGLQWGTEWVEKSKWGGGVRNVSWLASVTSLNQRQDQRLGVGPLGDHTDLGF